MPLPPASGTVIGILIDSAHDLALLDDQVVRLREIDTRLDIELRSHGSRGASSAWTSI